MTLLFSTHLWLVLSLLTAIVAATQDACAKKFFSHLSHYEMTSYPMFYAIPMFLTALFFIDVPSLDKEFYINFIIGIPLNGFCFLFYNKAIKISPLSLTVPYLAFTPTFIIGTGYLFLNEVPNIYGILGIFTTCIGGYILNIDINNYGFFEPFKAIFKETGSWIMLVLSFLFSFAAVIGKVAILHSSPLFFSVSFFLSLNLFVIITFFLTGKIQLKTFAKMPVAGLFTGLFYFVHVICHGYAIVLTKAAYMISVKRLSILISIIYGGIIFNEKNIAIRFCGGLLMLSGAVLIILKGK